MVDTIKEDDAREVICLRDPRPAAGGARSPDGSGSRLTSFVATRWWHLGTPGDRCSGDGTRTATSTNYAVCGPAGAEQHVMMDINDDASRLNVCVNMSGIYEILSVIIVVLLLSLFCE